MLQQPDPVYPDCPTPNSFQVGLEFQDFVCDQLARHHVILQNMCSKRYQYERGENLQGFEIKFDGIFLKTGRLSIEVAEKRNRRVKTWTPSGIYRNDNSWLYIQGNYDVLFVFAKNWLQRYEQRYGRIEESHGTVRKFYIPLKTARIGAVKVFDARMVAPRQSEGLKQALEGDRREP